MNCETELVLAFDWWEDVGVYVYDLGDGVVRQVAVVAVEWARQLVTVQVGSKRVAVYEESVGVDAE